MRHLQLLGLCTCVCLGVLTSGCASIGEGRNQSAAPDSAVETRLLSTYCEFKRDGVDSPIRHLML